MIIQDLTLSASAIRSTPAFCTLGSMFCSGWNRAFGTDVQRSLHPWARVLVMALLVFPALTPTAVAQLARWILPPYVVQWDADSRLSADTLPVHSTSGENGAHTIMTDVDGRILFYIVDGPFRDSAGNEIDSFSNYGSDPTYGSEIVVMPVPGSPSNYYLVGAGRRWGLPGIPEFREVQPGYFPVLLCGMLDLGRTGAFLVQEIPMSEVSISSPDDILLAASYTQNGDHGYLFVKHYNELERYDVTESGIAYEGPILQEAMYNTDQWTRLISEMELNETVHNDMPISRLAVPYYNPSVGVIHILVLENVLDDAVMATDIDMKIEVEVMPGDTVSAAMPGIEFSPNGRYLYVTTPLGLQCFDICKEGDSVPVEYAESTLPFMRSQIETGPDGNLYLAGPGGLARIRNPNDAPGTWDSIALALPDLEPVGGPDGVYMLQDQIDRPGTYNDCGSAGVEDDRDETSAGPIVRGQPYPSITQGMFVVPYSVQTKCPDGVLRIMDVTGRRVQECRLESPLVPGERTAVVDLSMEPSGTYFVTIEVCGAYQTARIAVVR